MNEPTQQPPWGPRAAVAPPSQTGPTGCLTVFAGVAVVGWCAWIGILAAATVNAAVDDPNPGLVATVFLGGWFGPLLVIWWLRNHRNQPKWAQRRATRRAGKPRWGWWKLAVVGTLAGVAIGGLGYLGDPDFGLGEAAVSVVLYGLVPFLGFGAASRGLDVIANRQAAGGTTPPPPHNYIAEIIDAPDPVKALQGHSAELGGGSYLGIDPATKTWSTADREHAVFVLGPPRSGKTSCVIIPAVAAASGPVVSTSTKPEIMEVTGPLRSTHGTVWHFDPAGADSTPSWAKPLAWSPVTSSKEWDRALLMARSMVASAQVHGRDVSDASHWTERGTALLAPLLHAAALDDRPISELVSWVLRHDLEPAEYILATKGGSPLAQNSLTSITETHERERSSIFSTVSNVLAAYNTEAALTRADKPNFDPARFVDRHDTPTIYITAPAQHQNLVAPLVVALLEDIRNATYSHHRHSPTTPSGLPWTPVFYALDEAANIAPIPNLPALVSEAGGQGLQVLAAFQDLSQARHRWTTAGEGFLSLFSQKLVFGGIGDPATLQALETLLGDWDRPISTNSTSTQFLAFPANTTGWTTQRAPLVTAAEIANLPPNQALGIHPNGWGLIELTPYYRTTPWVELTKTSRT